MAKGSGRLEVYGFYTDTAYTLTVVCHYKEPSKANKHMRKLRNILKKLLKLIGILLLVIILTGLACRILSPKPAPPGKLVDVGGFKLHINGVGEKNNKPTLIIESGAGAPGEYYHWLSEGLKDSIRVVRYDRAGIGYSELANTPRHPKTVAKELHKLLEEAGESPPYIMAGHSYGGHYIRIFTQLYRDEVAALVFLDSGHPDESKRLNMPKSPWFIPYMYKVGTVLADLGVLNLYDRTLGPILWAPGLPEEVTNRFTDYTVNGKFLRGYRYGDGKWKNTLKELSSKANNFDSLPIRVFSGTHLNKDALIKRGLNPEKVRTERRKMQKEMADQSTKGKVFFMDGGHITIFTIKKNADFICSEIIALLKELE